MASPRRRRRFGCRWRWSCSANKAKTLASPNGTAPRASPTPRRVVAAVAVEFPHVTAEHVRVALNMLGQGGLLASAYREIDPATGAATVVPAVDVVALLRCAHAAGPDAATAGEWLTRLSLDRWPVVPRIAGGAAGG